MNFAVYMTVSPESHECKSKNILCVIGAKKAGIGCRKLRPLLP